MSVFEPHDAANGGSLSAVGDITIDADNDASGAGDIVFRTGLVERFRVKAAGKIAGLLSPLLGWVNVEDPTYGAIGDGITDDTTALNAAFATGKRVIAPPGRTYLVTGNVNVTVAGQRFNFYGSVLKKAPTMNGSALVVTGASVSGRQVEVDGNRANGALGNGISWRAAGGKLYDSYSHSSTGQGVSLSTNAGSSLECHNVVSSDHVSGTLLGRGFYCPSGMTLQLYGKCVASGCDENGVLIDSGANTDCHLSVETTGNTRAGVSIRNQGGTGGRIYCHDDTRYGLVFEKNGPANWRIADVQSDEIGKTAVNVSGTGMEFIGATSVIVEKHSAKGCLGYCVGFAYEATVGATNQPSSYCHVGEVDYDRGTAADSDPAIHVSGGSFRNYVGPGSIRRVTLAVMIGEGYNAAGALSSSGAAAANDHNTFGPFQCDALTHAVLVIDSGSNNEFRGFECRDCITSGSGNLNNYWQALINFVNFHQVASPRTDPVKNNIVRYINHRSPAGTKPVYVVTSDNDTTNITGNRLLGGFTNSDYTTGRWLDAGGVNGQLWRLDNQQLGLKAGVSPQRRWALPYANVASASQVGVIGRVYLLEFEVVEDAYVDAISYIVGAASSGNVTLGVYGPLATEDTAAAAPVAVQSASTAQGTINVEQIVTLTKTLLAAGRYYAALEMDNTTGTYVRLANQVQSAGWHQQYDRGGGYGTLTDPCPAVTSSGSAMPALRVRLASAV